MTENSIGRPGIDKDKYVSKIQEWLASGESLESITATNLQKAVGGQYRKAVTMLKDFKEGYETRELSDLPDMPERLTNLLNSAALSIWRELWEQKRNEVDSATEVFEKERLTLEALAIERLERIDTLESTVDELRTALVQSELDVEKVRAETAAQLSASADQLRNKETALTTLQAKYDLVVEAKEKAESTVSAMIQAIGKEKAS